MYNTKDIQRAIQSLGIPEFIRWTKSSCIQEDELEALELANILYNGQLARGMVYQLALE